MARRRSLERRISVALIVLLIGMQGLAVLRPLCPPRSLPCLAPLRVACPPRLWPFLDYPRFSAPHRQGDVLAWIDVRIATASGMLEARGLHEVHRRSPREPLGEACAREEARLRAAFRAELDGTPAGSALLLEHQCLVLTRRGLLPPTAPVEGME